MSFDGAPFRRSGTPPLHCTFAAATSATAGPLWVLGSAYGNWGLRVRINGPATSGQVQLRGTIASSSDVGSAFQSATTWDGTVNTSDDTLAITGKPFTAVQAFLNTPSSSNTTIDVWIAGSA